MLTLHLRTQPSVFRADSEDVGLYVQCEKVIIDLNDVSPNKIAQCEVSEISSESRGFIAGRDKIEQNI